MAAEVSTKNLKATQNESTVESTDSEERSETSVEVKAQVMKRSDAGWVPIDGGGLSVVGLSTLPTDENVDEVQYRVNARRVKDNASLLSCILKKDLAYTKGNPLFHHWQTQGQKFGLTFHSSTDACTFEQWICNAKQNLAGSNANCEKPDQACDQDSLSRDAILAARLIKDTVSLPGSRARTPSPGASNRVNMRHSSILLSSYPSSYPALHNIRLHREDDKTGRCTMPCATAVGSGKRKLKLHQRQNDDHVTSVWIKREDLSMPEFSTAGVVDNSYVQFSKSDSKANCNNFNIVHEYFYPTLDSVDTTSKLSSHPESHERHSKQHLSPTSGLSRAYPRSPGVAAASTTVADTFGACSSSSSVALRLPRKSKKKKKSKSRQQKTLQRECFSVSSLSSKRSSSGNLQQLQLHLRRRCVRCREFYVESENRNGKCPYGSDRCVRCIEAVTCVACARAILYHLAADENGDYGHICSCSDGHHRNARKWLVLAFLSIFLPCFWCYAPLEACRRCCIRRGNCGSRHKSE